MTYLAFHAFFILPPIVLLAFVVASLDSVRRRDIGIVLLLSAIALVYTTAWDNYLIYKNVWSYGPDRVLGTIGYVPIEEYLFFIFQPLLSGLWLLWMLHLQKPERMRSNVRTIRRLGAAVGLSLTVIGGICLMAEESLYMGLILVWAGPVVSGQWFLAGETFLNRACLIGIAAPTVYLWIADRFALNSGIWSISDRYTVGWDVFGLPVEEALFFLITNVLVVQGILMFHPLRSASERRPLSTSQNPSYL